VHQSAVVAYLPRKLTADTRTYSALCYARWPKEFGKICKLRTDLPDGSTITG